MAQFIKPAGAIGLNTGHALYADLHAFYEFGLFDSELVGDTALTISGASQVDDADIGISRAFVAGATITETASIPQDCTVLLVTAGRGTRSGTTASDCSFLYNVTSGNKIFLRYSYTSSGTFQVRYDGASGDVRNLSSDGVVNDEGFDTGLAIAFHFAASAVMKSCLNGTIGSATETTATAAALSSPPFAVPFFATDHVGVTIGATANFPIGALIVFDRLLSDAEMQSVTTDPWAMLSAGAAVGTLVGVQGDDIIASGEQDITGSVSGLPSGNIPIGVRIGSAAGVGGTYLTGFNYATTATAGVFTFEANIPSGITTGTNMEVAVEYEPS